MTAQKWSDIRARKFTPPELREIDREIGNELLEMDLRAPQEVVGFTQGELAPKDFSRTVDRTGEGSAGGGTEDQAD